MRLDKITFAVTSQEMALLLELMRKWRRSKSDAVREAIRQAAEAEGIRLDEAPTVQP